MYMTVLIFQLSWEVSVGMETDFCVSALERSLRLYGRPETFNTDQGAQYISNEFTGTLKEQNIKISMDSKGLVMDNIMIERLWRTVKYEEIYPKEYDSVKELKTALRAYFNFYNYERSYSSPGGRSPADVYFKGDELKQAVGW